MSRLACCVPWMLLSLVSAHSVGCAKKPGKVISEAESPQPEFVMAVEERVSAEDTVLRSAVGVIPSGPNECQVRRYAVESGKVIEVIVVLPMACPKSWSMTFTEDKTKALVQGDGAWLVDVGAKTATPLPKTDSLSPTLSWNQGSPTVTYEIAPPDEAAQKQVDEYWDMRGLPLLFCQSQTLVDGEWVTQDDIWEAYPSEGTYGPYCIDDNGDDAHEVSNSRLHFEEDCEEMEAEQVASARAFVQDEDGFEEWCWASLSEPGAIAISTVWNEGMHPTGRILGWNGTEWHRLPHVESPVNDVYTLQNAQVYVCTDTGHGVFNPDDGSVTYWKTSPCLGFEPQ